MRLFRFAALVGSLVLLVTTGVSAVDRRGDIRDDQVAKLEQSSVLLSESLYTSITRLREDVHLAAIAAADPTRDDRALADDLVRFFPDAEACANDAAGCTGTDLFALPEVDALAELSARSDAPIDGGSALAQIGVDAGGESLLVVRRVSTSPVDGLVAMRVPVSGLVSERMRAIVAEVGVSFEISARDRDSGDAADPLRTDGDRRVDSETIGSPFAFGSLDVTLESTRSVGIAGEETARFATLLALGTVLLALAGWTFLVERRNLERRATTDELTGLINRREFERVSAVAIEMADRFNTGLCVMVLDLNGFKQVNDTLGHQYGDLVLSASADRLVDAVRDTDVVGRWGGDEFVILLPGLAERTAARNSAERIWHRLSSSPVVGDTTVSASIGAAIFPRHGTTLDALMRHADVAMYEAKTTGVSHRIADTIEVNNALLTESSHVLVGSSGTDPEDLPRSVVSDDYIGFDRRRGPDPVLLAPDAAGARTDSAPAARSHTAPARRTPDS